MSIITEELINEERLNKLGFSNVGKKKKRRYGIIICIC